MLHSPSLSSVLSVVSPKMSSRHAASSEAADQRVRRSSEASPGALATSGNEGAWPCETSGRSYPPESGDGAAKGALCSVSGLQPGPQRHRQVTIADAVCEKRCTRVRDVNSQNRMNSTSTYAIAILVATASAACQPSGADESTPTQAPLAPSEPVLDDQAAPGDDAQDMESLTLPTEPVIPLRARNANEGLVGSAWVAVDSDSAIQAVTFGEATVSLLLRDGTTETRWADFAATHPLCQSYPRCILTVDPEGRPMPLFANQSPAGLYFIDCRDFRITHSGVDMPQSDAELGELIEAFPEWRDGTHYCYSLDPAVFTPRY